MIAAEPFETARLAMRRQRVGDAPALFEAYRDVDLMRYWSSAPHKSVEETRDYLDPREDHQDWRGWSITLKGNDTAIGTLAATTRRPGVAEIGYLLARKHWRRGYAREAVTALIDLLFAEGHRRVFADTDPDNIASIAMLEQLGFRREGLLRQEWETHIGVRDTLLLGLLRDEWLASGYSRPGKPKGAAVFPRRRESRVMQGDARDTGLPPSGSQQSSTLLGTLPREHGFD